MKRIVQAECLQYIATLPEASFPLIYLDPPFNTRKTQKRRRIRAIADEMGQRQGFGGKRYRTEELAAPVYPDRFEDFAAFLIPRLEQAYRLLTPTGSLFVHLDYREVHYIKVALDAIFGRKSFINEIIWAYDYGGRPKNRWPAKHDTLLWYAKDPRRYTFNYEAIDRIPYLAPKVVGPQKAARGKTPTDVWWLTIVPTGSKEKTGYPTQKPLRLLERIVRVHSHPGEVVLDFFAGSGTTGEAAARNGRGFLLVDENPAAIEIMRRRLAPYGPEIIVPNAPHPVP
ncbi:Modification methylase RsrI [Meiothermus luteus]|jgi:site-specific DNA-methyltransferase (adenine-specific)|uniref:Modification methylase RsrI n=1 Tax=Meiothermus luteus TaxID=2026184 RepID=A0A399EPI2_9DEIN|nr:site-specific DNA-methyltransferase [Meiothermus luteus]RIH86537.1 Modification methylase RsrI [Meiothermus luteus]RMH54359.1 MAG: site-specific DNA-methyltransferase [Deinococcota bacterium]